MRARLRRAGAWLAGSLLALVAAGCARPLAVSPGLTESTVRLPAQKLDRKSINFGDHHVREIRRGWETGGGVQVGPYSAARSSRDFSFMVTRGDVSMQVLCHVTEESAAVDDMVVESTSWVICDLNPSSAGDPWKVILVHRDGTPSQGRLEQGTRELQIMPAHDSRHFGSRGYLIREGGDVAAADVGRKTRAMWLPTAAEPEESLALAGAAMTLMLLEEVR
jgi:hypothetical protein